MPFLPVPDYGGDEVANAVDVPQTFTPITNSQSADGTSVILVPCIGTPALLQAIWSFPKLRSAAPVHRERIAPASHRSSPA